MNRPTRPGSVARRIHLAFMIATAAPLLLLAVSTYQMASARLERFALDNAHHLAKSIGMTVFDRLQFVSDQLMLLNAYGTAAGQPADLADLHLDERVLGVVRVDGGEVSGTVSLDPFERTEIARAADGTSADRPLLLALGPPGARRLFLLTAETTDRNLGVELNLEHLWDSAGILARPEYVCVLDDGGIPVFCNHADDSGAWLEESAALIAERGRPRRIAPLVGEPMLTAVWSLFLKPHYGLERSTVAVGIPESTAFEAIHRFDRIFAIVFVIAVLLAFLFSRRLIAHNLRPLSRLIRATQELTAGGLGYRLQLRTGDEFEQLGEAFDNMAGRIGSQFNELEVLSDLEHALQKARDVGELVRPVTKALDALLGSREFAIICHERWHPAGEVWCKRYGAKGLGIREYATACRVLPLASGDTSLPTDVAQCLGAPASVSLTCRTVLKSDLIESYVCTQPLNEGRSERLKRVIDVFRIALTSVANARRLFYQARHDWLSGLPNRERIRELFEEWAAASDHRAIGMLLIGVDRFKQINDAVGHAMGDQLLAAIGRRLEHSLPDDAVLGRFAGDQFILMQGGEAPAALVQALADVHRRIVNELDRPFELGSGTVRLSATVGAAIYPEDAGSFSGMLHALDAASYAAKESRRGGMLWFSREMRQRLAGRMETEQALKGAVANGELVLHFQPVVDATTGRVHSAEALIRWQRPGIGLVSPGDFVEIAEQSGLVVEIGAWAIGEVCRQVVAWRQAGVEMDTVNVNVSTLQLYADSFETVVPRALEENRLEPHLLTLEVTESSLIERYDEVIGRLKRLREIGVSIMIDDFGTGYASLKYLKVLPISGLKIDRMFVRDLTVNETDRAIVSSVVSLAKASGFKLVAEGIETVDQAEILRDIGVPYLQGYLFAKGLPAEDFQAFARADERGIVMPGRRCRAVT